MAATTLGLTAIVLGFRGLDRPFVFDESITVGRFVTAPTAASALSRQAEYNNHVLFSVGDWIVHAITGSTDERVLRLLPLAAFGLAVGLLANVLIKHFGIVAGVLGALVLTTSPLAFEFCRQIRGYSFLVLFSVASTLVLLSLLGAASDSNWPDASRPTDEPRPKSALVGLYIALLACGVATHLYMLGVVIVHMSIVAARATLRAWWWRWVIAVAIGVLPLWWLLQTLRRTPQIHSFRPKFPLVLLRALLGGSLVSVRGSLVSVLFALPLMVVALWTAHHRRDVLSALVTGALLVSGVWLFAARYLDPRFFIWMLPAIALGVAAAVAQRPKFALLAVALVVSQGHIALHHAGDVALANRSAARIVRRAVVTGAAVCMFPKSWGPLVGYVELPRVVTRAYQMTKCDIVVSVEGGEEEKMERKIAADIFPKSETLHAKAPGIIFYRADAACLHGAAAPRCWSSDRQPSIAGGTARRLRR